MKEFQSTLPVGGATISTGLQATKTAFQSTLPVGGATPPKIIHIKDDSISIHAPRGGSD